MSEHVQITPVYLESGGEAIFGFLHTPAERWTGTAIVIVGPWGWDDVATYQSRREWAGQLAGRGHVVLRYDHPSLGDSAGIPADPDRVGAWTRAVRTAVTAARSLEGCSRVAVIGIGLGGLIAGHAIIDGVSIDALVLWGSPTTGPEFSRAARAFSRLQTSRYTLTGEPEPHLLPDGWMEVGGFVLTAETIDAVGSLDLKGLPAGRLGRALLLELDGLPVDGALRAHLEDVGVATEVRPGNGWAAMCFDIEHHQPPVEVFETVAAWLDDGSGRTVTVGRTPGMFKHRVEIAVGADRVREAPFAITQHFGSVFGILAEPMTASSSPVCALFLNAGAVRRQGPNRMWVEAARRWAAQGIPSLRIDVEGIGDASGDPRQYADVGAFYRPAVGAEVRAALDALESEGFGRRFVLIGLCSGAYWAFHTAVDDDRVASTVLLNARALVWDPDLPTRREARVAQKILTAESWRRFLRGEIQLGRIAGVGRAILRRGATAAVSIPHRYLMRRPAAQAESVESLFDRLDQKGTNVVLAFANDELLATELRASGLPEQFVRWPKASFIQLPGRDHTVRPIVAQDAVQEVIDVALARERDEAASVSPPD